MKRPVAFYMLLIMASIFLFFFLNLVLGSVSIPLRAVWNIPLRSCKRFPAAEGQTPFRRLFSGNEMLKGFGPEGRKCHEIESSRSGAALPCRKRRSAPCRRGQRRGRGVFGNQSLWGPGFRCEF